MPGFAPLAAAPLGSVGGDAPRHVTAAGSLDLQGQALAGLWASASADDLAPSFAGEASGRGTVDAVGRLGTVEFAAHAQGDTAMLGFASGAILPREGAVDAKATPTAAFAGTLKTALLAQSGLVCAIHADGFVPMGGAHSATSRIIGSAVRLWQVLSHADAATAVSVQLEAGRLVPLAGTGQLQVAGRGQAAGAISLTGAGQLAAETCAHAQTAVAAAGAAEAQTSLSLTLAADLALSAAASGITLQGREARAGSVVPVPGQSSGSSTLSAGLTTAFAPPGTARAQATLQAWSQGVIGIARAGVTEVQVGAATTRILPLGGVAAAHSALRAEAQTAVAVTGLGGSVVVTRADLSAVVTSGLVAAAEAHPLAGAQGAFGVMAQGRVSASVGLSAASGLHLGLDASGLSQIAAHTIRVGLPLGGEAHGGLRGAAAADARLAVNATSEARTNLRLKALPQIAFVAAMDGRADQRAHLLGPVTISGLGHAALEGSGAAETRPLPLAGRMLADLAVSASAAGRITFARGSLGEVGIDAISAPGLALDLELAGALASRGGSADTLAVSAASRAAIALGGGLEDRLPFEAAAAMRAHVASLSGSALALGGTGRARIAGKVWAVGAVTVARDSDGEVAVSGKSRPALPIAGSAVLAGAVMGVAPDRIATIALLLRGSAAISAAGETGLPTITAAGGDLALRAQAAARFQVGRDGSADVDIAADAARIIAFPGRGVGTVANDAEAGSGVFTQANGTAATRVLLRLTGEAIHPQGTAQSSVTVRARLQREPMTALLLARGFRAPPGLRRRARPDTAQGGSVISHLRSGQILRG